MLHYALLLQTIVNGGYKNVSYNIAQNGFISGL
jgi:hypothetical protein